MILILLSILFGVLTADFLCSPFNYYPIFILLFLLLPLIVYFSRNIIAKYSKIYYIISIIAIFTSYSVTSYAIFHTPKTITTRYTNSPGTKTAVIFFAVGEMTTYSPYLASGYLRSTPTILKPLYCIKIKSLIKPKSMVNDNLLNTSEAVKASILNNGPYIYYSGLFNNGQRLNKIIHQAYVDGCYKILIINYSTIPITNIESQLTLQVPVSIKITAPILTTDPFIKNLASRIKTSASASPSDGIFIIDTSNPVSAALKAQLIESGYIKNKILISPSLKTTSKFSTKDDIEKILFVNITQGQNIESDFSYSKNLDTSYNGIKSSQINITAFDNNNIKIIINAFKTIK